MTERSSESYDPVEGDGTLVVRFVEGDRAAASEIYRRYVRRLHALARSQASPAVAARVETEDIVQSIFRTFFRRAAQGAYEVPDGEELWKLFLVIAMNKIRNLAAFHTAGKRDVRKTMGGDSVEQARESDDEHSAQVLKMVIDDMLERLPADSRQIVRDRIDGLEVAEIARKAGRSKRTVERVLQGFRTLMSHEFSEHD